MNVRRDQNTEQYEKYINIIHENICSSTEDELGIHEFTTLHDILSMDHDIFHSFNIEIFLLMSNILENLNRRKFNDHETKIINSFTRYSEKVEKLVEFLDNTETRHYARYNNIHFFYTTLEQRANGMTDIMFTGPNVQKLKAVLEQINIDIRLQHGLILDKTRELRIAVEKLNDKVLEVNTQLQCIQNLGNGPAKLVVSLQKTLIAQLEPLMEELNTTFANNLDVSRFMEVDSNIRAYERSEDKLLTALDDVVPIKCF